MTRFTFKNAGLSEKPITRDEYRVIAIVAILSMLLMAAIVFAIDHRWQVAAVTAVLSIPGGLFGGVLWCVLRRGCPKPTTWREVAEQGSLRPIAISAFLAALMYIVLCYAIPSQLTRLVVVITQLACFAIARRLNRRGDGTS